MIIAANSSHSQQANISDTDMTHLTHAMRRLHLLACCDDVSTHDDFAQLERAVSAQLDRLAAVLARQDGTDCIACC